MENNKSTIENDSKDMNIILDFLLILYHWFKYILKLFSLDKYLFFSLWNIFHFLSQTIWFIIFVQIIDNRNGGREDLGFAIIFVYLVYYIVVRFIFEFIMLWFSINNKLEKIVLLMEENKVKEKVD